VLVGQAEARLLGARTVGVRAGNSERACGTPPCANGLSHDSCIKAALARQQDSLNAPTSPAHARSQILKRHCRPIRSMIVIRLGEPVAI
jgi:hypothetical protein